jgi:chorismate dehydratase
MPNGSFTVGCVPYVNAIPLIHTFLEWGDESPVQVVFDVPSRLPTLLETGQAQAIMVSSFDALTVPDRRMAAGACIGSRGPVESVRLFSKVPYDRIRTLALDASSMTSNALAQLILQKVYDARFEIAAMPPHLETMLEQADACVLIGDIGMAADGSALNVLDLGDAWVQWTGKPFVWAAWIGGKGLTSELAFWLALAAAPTFPLDSPPKNLAERAAAWHAQNALPTRPASRQVAERSHRAQIEQWTDRALATTTFARPQLERYFRQTMAYRLDDELMAGLLEFQTQLREAGFPAHYFPELVAPVVPSLEEIARATGQTSQK